MKQEQWYLIAGLSTFILGVGIWFYTQERFVIYIPNRHNQISKDERAQQATKKKISLQFWDGKAMQQEELDIMWSSLTAKNIQHIVQQLFGILADEGVITDKTSLQSVIISPSGQDIYLSFNQSFFKPEQSIRSKHLILECLKSSIAHNIDSQGTIHFLINHKSLQDPHIDFSEGWPIYPD